jgi:hypothetical protein
VKAVEFPAVLTKMKTKIKNAVFCRLFSRAAATIFGFVLPIIWFFAGTGGSAAVFDAATIKGTVRVATANGVKELPNAKITLINQSAKDVLLETVSNGNGEFVFENLAAGDYVLKIAAENLKTVSREIRLAAGEMLQVVVELSAEISETVTVRAEEGLLSTSETATSNIVRAETLRTQPLRADNFQAGIALTPGVLRDGNGNDYLKGTRPGQSSYAVNGADVTDPVTGRLAFEIPLEAAQMVQIEENPYSAEFGRFTGAATNLQTKGGADKFKISAARFFPTLRNVFSTKIDSFRPRLTVSGAFVPKRFYFLQSFEYRFRRDVVPSQPKPNNNITQEGFNSFTQFDLNLNKNNSFKFNFAIFPNKLRNLNLDSFNPPAATPNYKQRGIFASISEQAVFGDTSFLSSQISYKTFDTDVFAKSNQPFNVLPETASGGYFADTRRRTKRFQWLETYYSRPLKAAGEHLLKTGFEFNRTGVAGQLRYNSIFIRRSNNTLAQRIDFTNALPLSFRYSENAVFVQDKWKINNRLTVDAGIRFDRDGVAKSNNFAPRLSLLLLPFKNEKTILRGGIGLFYDRTLATAKVFDLQPNNALEQIPQRVVTNFAADGVTIIGAARRFDNQIAGRLHSPRSVRWSVQLDRQIAPEVIARAGFLSRRTQKDLLIQPVALPGASDALVLSSRGKSNYDELQLVAATNPLKYGQWNASYVFSRARGDSNAAERFFGDAPALVARPSEFAPLPFDAPHRFLLYGQLDIFKRHDIRVAPLFEIRSGFPFSNVNERLEIVGSRNRAGRFPIYLSLDVQVTKGFQLPFFKNKRARVGIALFNVTNHFNPRDVQNNLNSPFYGQFYNSLGTAAKARFDLDF